MEKIDFDEFSQLNQYLILIKSINHHYVVREQLCVRIVVCQSMITHLSKERLYVLKEFNSIEKAAVIRLDVEYGAYDQIGHQSMLSHIWHFYFFRFPHDLS